MNADSGQMTKREPFARVERWEDTCFVVTFPGWTSVRNVYTRSEAVELANKMNATHDARVKEEVEKAVAPFKDELRRLVDVVCEEDRKSILDVLGEAKP